ncbi:DNA methyltransferase [Amnibacterium sp.]|uniref:DNA methyltransferase n=1 Tax=Amnibacterium sp. TaxID=1872496 RepID=UPI003F7CB78A
MPSTSSKPKPLSTTEMVRRAQRFVAAWRDAERENADAQSWWNDLFDVFGVDRRSVAVFERRARRASTGEVGRIDVFMPGVMIAEHKSRGRDLNAAGSQAEDYLASGDISAAEMPRYIVSTDFDRVVVTDLESPADEPVSFRVVDLARNVRQFAFLSGYRAPRRVTEAQEAVTVKAARAMGALYDALLGDLDAAAEGHDSHDAAIFMTRLLFLLYGDDAEGLWEDGAFERFVRESTAEDGSDAGALITQLFQVLDTPLPRRSAHLDDRLKVFPYVNGGLFRERVDIPTFDRGMRDALLAACAESWDGVSPAIFGALFQGLSSRRARHGLGEHYTTEGNILKTLRPLLLDEMEEALKAAWPSEQALERLHESRGGIRYLDPACGCGNFLIVAYREMRDLELRLLERLRELRGETTSYMLDATWTLRVTPDQFAGIEINWWPARIAETAMFLVDHQANRRMAETLGHAPERLPITVAASIVHADALTLDWAATFPTEGVTTYVFGNPPFLGKAQRTGAQTDEMAAAWGAAYSGEMDFVTAWFILAARYLDGAEGRFAFVATNSVAQGVVVPSLFGPLFGLGWRIRFAHRTFAWTTEATDSAAVHCIVVGFDRGGAAPRLFEYATPSAEPVEVPAVGSINGYLVNGPVVFASERRTPLAPALASRITFGSMAADGGHLFLELDEVAEALADEVARPYIRRFVGARELIRVTERWCIWMPEPDARAISASPLLRRHVEAVRAWRSVATDDNVRRDAGTPYRFHRVNQPEAPYLCIPRHFSEARTYATVAYLDPDVVAGDATFVTPDPDGLRFAVISSTMFLTWQLTVGGRLKSDYRFGSTSVWNTFPLPALSDAERGRVIEAGRRVLDARAAHEGASLADLYSPLAMPTDLLAAHAELDRLIDRAFGFAKPPVLEARQERLFTRYAEATSAPELTGA